MLSYELSSVRFLFRFSLLFDVFLEETFTLTTIGAAKKGGKLKIPYFSFLTFRC